MLLATDASRTFLGWCCTQPEVVKCKTTEEELSVLLATFSERSSPRLNIGILG